MATAGLFNTGGSDLEALQRQLDEQRANDFSKMSTSEKLSNLAYTSTAGLGRAVLGAFGVDATDPALKATLLKNRIASEIDYTDHNSVAEGIRKLSQGGFVEEARQLSAALDTSKKTRAEAEAKVAEKLPTDVRTGRELASLKLKIDGLKKMEQTDPAVQQALENFQAQYDALSGLTAKDKISFGSDAERISRALFGTTFDKLTPEQAARVNKEVFNQEQILKATGAPKQTVINAQETSFAKQRGELQAKSLADAETQAKASSNAVNRLTGMEKLNKGTMITGPLAGTAIGAGQFLSSLGLLSPDSAKTLSSSEVYDKLAKDLVMQDLGGKLGANISNADRDFIEARIPQLRNSAQARTDLIGKLKEIHTKNIDYYQRMSKHANAKGSLNDFDFASSAPDTGPALGTKENPIKLK